MLNTQGCYIRLQGSSTSDPSTVRARWGPGPTGPRAGAEGYVQGEAECDTGDTAQISPRSASLFGGLGKRMRKQK
jgi:hypothetical protein